MTNHYDTVISLMNPPVNVELTVWQAEGDHEGHTFHSVLEQAITKAGVPHYLLIPAASTFMRLQQKITVPLVVGALIGEGPVPYIFYPVIDAIETKMARGFWIYLPKDMSIQTVQRRSFARIKTRLPVVLETDLLMPAYTLDLSGGGLQFACAQVFEPGAVINLQLNFPSDAPAMWLSAKVVGSRENPLSLKPEDAYATSCQFVDVSPQRQSALMAECFRIELWDKKHLQQ